MQTRRFLQLIVGLCAGLGAAHAQGNPEEGMNKFYTCTGCHAIPGYTNVYPTYHVPRLGGQHPQYIIAALTAYQNGERTHPTMIANATTLTEQDKADIAAYVSQSASAEDEPDLILKGDSAAGQQKSQPCQACHGENGNSPDPNFPRLAGQYEDYLRKALHDYKSGARKNAIMSSMAAPLSDTDIADLSAYFASQERALATMPLDE